MRLTCASASCASTAPTRCHQRLPCLGQPQDAEDLPLAAATLAHAFPPDLTCSLRSLAHSLDTVQGVRSQKQKYPCTLASGARVELRDNHEL